MDAARTSSSLRASFFLQLVLACTLTMVPLNSLRVSLGSRAGAALLRRPIAPSSSSTSSSTRGVSAWQQRVSSSSTAGSRSRSRLHGAAPGVGSQRDTSPYFITTPIYYVNGQPHLGHAYTSVVRYPS